jgi:hypothetical protein
MKHGQRNIKTLNVPASATECEGTNIHQTDCCMEHVQITFKYKRWTLSYSYPCSDVTSLRKHPTNALIYTMLIPLYSHCYTPTCFSPQGAIHREH